MPALSGANGPGLSCFTKLSKYLKTIAKNVTSLLILLFVLCVRALFKLNLFGKLILPYGSKINFVSIQSRTITHISFDVLQSIDQQLPSRLNGLPGVPGLI